MKIICAQPAVLRFQWELDVLLTNLRKKNNPYPVVVLFARHQDSVVRHIQKRYPEVEVHVYEERPNPAYISSVRGWLMYKYLSEDRSREEDSYFYIDSDIIFREIPDVENVGATENVWIGSDCGGYIDYDYLITRENGEEIVRNFALLTGVTEDIIKETPGLGAQWVIVKPKAEMWFKTYEDGNAMWKWLKPFKSDIQKWTAEMWVNLYAMRHAGITVQTHPELAFCTATDSVKMWDVVKILHNAGVPSDNRVTFFKGKYDHRTPFYDDLSFVRRDKASIKYVEAIKDVML